MRGICYFHLTVRTGERDLHSGMFGGAALPATHALMEVLAAVLPGPNGLLPEPLRAGIVPPTEDEVAGWEALPSGSEELASQGARPVDAPGRGGVLRPDDGRAVDHRQRRRGRLAAPPEDGAAGRGAGEPLDPARAGPVSLGRSRPCSSGCSTRPCPTGASLDVELWSTGDPGFVDPAAPAVRIAQDAFEQVLGTRPVLTRSGGSIPVVAALGARGVPAIVTGFTRPTSQLHSPNEHIPASALRDGLATTVELLRRLATVG